MADMQQLERAFLKAHKAGDTKAAGVLAAEIKRQRSSGSSSGAPKPVSGMLDQFWSGVDQPLEDIGTSMEAVGMTDTGKALRDFTKKPDNFESASSRFVNPAEGDSYVDPVLGFGWGNLAGATAEQAGGLAGSIGARAAGGLVGSAAGPGGAAAGALAGPALFTFARQIGPTALERAKNNGRAEPDWTDWAAAAATAGASGALDAIGVGKLGMLNQTVKEVGRQTATQVVTSAVKETGKKALKEGATEAGQSVVEQFGTTAGTDKGADIDLKRAVGEGIIGAGAAGGVDAAVNIAPTVRTVNDIRSVDSSVRNDPFARDRAEITQNINDIANGPARDGRELTPGEVSSMVADIQAQAEEAIKGQNLSKEDKAALIKGLKNAKGLSEERLNEIAGRSDSPDEIKALARKVQLVRSMTVQQQARKGGRGWAAAAARYGGGVAGAAIGQSLGTGAIEGAAIGTGVGRVIAQKLSGSQSQGARINDLVGKKQARRAQMLLDRYGPSEATTALNTLTEKAAANKAQKELDAQEQKAWQDTLNRIQMSNDIRAKAREQWEAAPPELKAQKKAEKEAVDLKTREERLKGLAIGAEQRRIRLEMLVNKMEAEKSTNALRVEKAQAERDLANARAQNASKSQILDLTGKLLKIADDIKLREQAIAKATAATKRAEKMAERVPQAKQAAKAAATQTAKRYAKMTAEQMDQVEVDQFGNPIGNRAQYRMKAEEIMKLQADGLVDAVKFEDKAIGNIFIEAIGDFKNAPGHKNQAIRMAIYERVKRAVPLNNLDAQRFIAMYIRPLAFAFEAAAGDPNSFGSSSRRPEGREDFGTTEDLGEDPPF